MYTTTSSSLTRDPLILVVDEDHEMRKALVGTLASERFNVAHTPYAKEGLQIAEKEKPDLIIIDLCLREENFSEMVRKFCLMNRWIQKTRFLLLIYLDTDKDILHGLLDGEPEYYLLSGSPEPAAFVQKVRSIVAKRRETPTR